MIKVLLLTLLLSASACTNKLAQSEESQLREAKLIHLVKKMQKRQDKINASLFRMRQQPIEMSRP